MTSDRLDAVGMVILRDSDGSEAIGGTCFLFRRDEVALTAAHCVPSEAAAVEVILPRISRRRIPVERIERHASGDVAALFLDRGIKDKQGYPHFAFWDHVGNLELAEQFFAYGFPVEGPAPEIDAVQPVPRIFVGHYQRFFQYAGFGIKPYWAGELSVPAPGGLSGGPVFRPGALQMVTGLVTANVESYAVTDSIEEVRDGGSVYRLESRKVISYGISLMLAQYDDWLNELVSPPPHR
jgi:hypothetical protein